MRLIFLCMMKFFGLEVLTLTVFSKKDIQDVIQISTFVHFSLACGQTYIKPLTNRHNIVGQQIPLLGVVE